MNRLLKLATVSAAGIALSIPAAFAAEPSAGTAGTQHSAAVAASNSANAKPIEALEAAAQRLRDAIQALAQAPAGERRNQAIRDGNRALFEVNEAMAGLPPDLLTAQADESAYRQSVDRLQQAAQRLRDATHALASQPGSSRRNDSIGAVNRALRETQQAMIDVPPTAWMQRSTTVAR